jgi:hypothetical protein
MRTALISFALLAAPGFLFAACSQAPDSAATSTSGAGGAPQCDKFLNDPNDNCYVCIHQKCCPELAVCDAHCVDCFTVIGVYDKTCGYQSRAVLKCSGDLCHEECFGNGAATTGTGGASSTSASGTGGTGSSTSGG